MQFHCLHAQSIVYIKKDNEYGMYSLYKLFDDRKDKVVYTLDNTQEEIDTSNENLYVDNNGKWTKVLKVIRHKRNPSSPMVFVKTKSSNFLVTQDNHRMSIKVDNNRYRYKEPKDICIFKDEVMLSRSNIWQHGNIKPFMNPYLIGCILGDGSLTTSTSLTDKRGFVYTGIQIAAKENMYDNKIRDKIIDIYTKTLKRPTFQKDKIMLYNHKIAEEFFDKCGRYSNRKHLPIDFIYYKDEDLAKLLCGLIDTDGSVSLYNRKKDHIIYIEISMNNSSILYELSLICDKLGIRHNIFLENTNKKNNSIKFKFNYQVYVLRIYPTEDNIQQYLQESIKCKDYTSFKKRRSNSYDRKNNVKYTDSMIVDYKPIYFRDNLDEDSYVYDLTTEDHSLSINGIHCSNTGGAASILYLTKELPELEGIINQENNDLIALKDIQIRVLDYESNSVDTYISKDFIVIDIETKEDIECHFKGDIEFNAMMASSVKNDSEDMILTYESGSGIGTISANATDTTNAVKNVQSILVHSNQFERPEDLVLELYEIFSGSATIPLLHFEILVSQLARDSDKIYYPYRYGSMTKPPVFKGIKAVPALENSKRGILFEKVLDSVTASVLNGNDDSDKRIKSDLEDLFDI